MISIKQTKTNFFCPWFVRTVSHMFYLGYIMADFILEMCIIIHKQIQVITFVSPAGLVIFSCVYSGFRNRFQCKGI